MDCAALPDRWWQNKALLESELAKHGGQWACADAHPPSQSTLAKWSKKLGLPAQPGGRKARLASVARKPPVATPGLTLDHKNGTGILVTEPTVENLGDVDAMLRDRGLDPAEWLVDRVTVNEWDSLAYGGGEDGQPVIVKLRQLKAILRRRPPIELLFPAIEVAERHAPRPGARAAAARLIVACGDQQAPYEDPELHGAFLAWLADVRPDEGVLVGDTCDFPTISRHPDRPRWSATPQECLNAGYRIVSDYRDASPDTRWRKLRGNHDWRLESELLTRAERMFNLKPAEIPGLDEPSGYSIRRLLHLDRLGIELVGDEGEKWELAEVDLGGGLSARHKAPSLKKWHRLNRSVLAGDSHRQSVRYSTVYEHDEPRVYGLVEIGCMALAEGLGYDEHPDWQQGFATAAVAEDGSHSFDLAVFRAGTLAWRGETWRAPRRARSAA